MKNGSSLDIAEIIEPDRILEFAEVTNTITYQYE